MLILILESTCLAGIKSGSIASSQMTASSFYSANWAPGVARLDGVRGWAPQAGRQGKINSFRRHKRKQNCKVVEIPPNNPDGIKLAKSVEH